jgi:hypothetical protein
MEADRPTLAHRVVLWAQSNRLARSISRGVYWGGMMLWCLVRGILSPATQSRMGERFFETAVKLTEPLMRGVQSLSQPAVQVLALGLKRLSSLL